jgi:hypothetical protein
VLSHFEGTNQLIRKRRQGLKTLFISGSNRNLMFRILGSEQEIRAAFRFLKERFMSGSFTNVSVNIPFHRKGLSFEVRWFPDHQGSVDDWIYIGRPEQLESFFVRAVMVILAFPLTILTMELFLQIVNAHMLWLVAGLVPGIHLLGFGSVILGSLLFSLLNLAIFAMGRR